MKISLFACGRKGNFHDKDFAFSLSFIKATRKWPVLFVRFVIALRRGYPFFFNRCGTIANVKENLLLHKRMLIMESIQLVTGSS